MHLNLRRFARGAATLAVGLAVVGLGPAADASTATDHYSCYDTAGDVGTVYFYNSFGSTWQIYRVTYSIRMKSGKVTRHSNVYVDDWAAGVKGAHVHMQNSDNGVSDGKQKLLREANYPVAIGSNGAVTGWRTFKFVFDYTGKADPSCKRTVYAVNF